MALSIVALCVFLFGAYAYGSVVILTIRHRSPVWHHIGDAAFGFATARPAPARDGDVPGVHGVVHPAQHHRVPLLDGRGARKRPDRPGRARTRVRVSRADPPHGVTRNRRRRQAASVCGATLANRVGRPIRHRPGDGHLLPVGYFPGHPGPAGARPLHRHLHRRALYRPQHLVLDADGNPTKTLTNTRSAAPSKGDDDASS